VRALWTLVAREWQRSEEKPSRKVVRRILNEQLVGFDINDNALRLSELALYLTAIELDPESRPRPLDLLRFKALRGETLFLKEGGAEVGSLGPVEHKFRGRFDVIVGNPPWTALEEGSAKKAVWVDNTRARVAELLGDERAAKFNFPDANPDLPFVWRATEWARQAGVIALVTNARWLFAQSKSAHSARRDLFEAIHVTGILNGAALRSSSVWPNISHPFCLLFAINERPPTGTAFQFISPELEVTPDKGQQHLRLDWNDAREVAVAELVKRPWALKVRFRGTVLDEGILEDTHRKGTPFGEYLKELGTKLSNGYQVGGVKGKQKTAQAMQGMPDLRGSNPGFVVNTARLPEFSRSTLLFPRDRSIYNAPLLIVHESMKVDETAPRASLAFEDVAFDERFDGVSFLDVSQGRQLATYLQLVIQSSFFTYVLLFLDGQFGVEREVVHKNTIERVPVVRWSDLTPMQQKRSALLAKRLRAGMSLDLLTEINEFIFDAFDFSDVQRETIFDTLNISLPTASTKANATRRTRVEERAVFAKVVAAELRDLLNMAVFVTPANEVGSPWHFLKIQIGRKALQPDLMQWNPRALVEAADEASASMVTFHVDAGTSLIGLLDQYRYWTRTRARLVASDFVSEKTPSG